MSDIEDLKQIIASAARFWENTVELAGKSLRRSDDNQHSLLVMQQQMLQLQAEMLTVKRDIRGL
ncbi:MAG: hypothetical protein AAFR31_11965 [Cyanobacteria bacterium J06627_8]